MRDAAPAVQNAPSQGRTSNCRGQAIARASREDREFNLPLYVESMMAREVWSRSPAWLTFLFANLAALYLPVVPLLFLLGMPRWQGAWNEVMLLPIAVVFILTKIRPTFGQAMLFVTAVVVFSLVACYSPRRRFYTMILFTFSATHAVIIWFGRWLND